MEPVQVLPSIVTRPDMIQMMEQMRREWDHAFQLQHMMGRDNEYIAKYILNNLE
jgi:hypothetical protein